MKKTPFSTGPSSIAFHSTLVIQTLTESWLMIASIPLRILWEYWLLPGRCKTSTHDDQQTAVTLGVSQRYLCWSVCPRTIGMMLYGVSTMIWAMEPSLLQTRLHWLGYRVFYIAWQQCGVERHPSKRNKRSKGFSMSFQLHLDTSQVTLPIYWFISNCLVFSAQIIQAKSLHPLLQKLHMIYLYNIAMCE